MAYLHRAVESAGKQALIVFGSTHISANTAFWLSGISNLKRASGHQPYAASVPDSSLSAFLWPKFLNENLPRTRKSQDLQAFTALGGISVLGCGIAVQWVKRLTTLLGRGISVLS